MTRFLYQKLIVLTILASGFIPQQALSEVFDAGNFRAQSLYGGGGLSAISQGIGVSMTNVESSDMPYGNESYPVDIEDQQLTITGFIEDLLKIFSID